ncbi:hypothetical protein NDU88_002782 [Pleurodeles waltl]|uniref:Uncharacterized protein n=1 Tax=Pleurodeles waltl TaxID=8319 RepID=A0AAV7MNP0_PLEWA|nr:hypothetical protein NDU88_002782 [Pleurodeles waltl]
MALGVLGDFAMAQEDKAGQQLLQPDDATDNDCSLHGPQLVEVERIDHRQISVNGYATEEANADVYILIKQDTTDLAH